MLDGLGLAESTPGPLILVTQFVGFLGAFRNPGGLDPVAAGILGAVVTVWATFAPSFLWIFLGAPFIERLRGNAVLRGALITITSAVVGVILNLAVWFGIHALFRDVRDVPFPGGNRARWCRGRGRRTPVPVRAAVGYRYLSETTLGCRK